MIQFRFENIFLLQEEDAGLVTRLDYTIEIKKKLKKSQKP